MNSEIWESCDFLISVIVYNTVCAHYPKCWVCTKNYLGSQAAAYQSQVLKATVQWNGGKNNELKLHWRKQKDLSLKLLRISSFIHGSLMLRAYVQPYLLWFFCWQHFKIQVQACLAMPDNCLFQKIKRFLEVKFKIWNM